MLLAPVACSTGGRASQIPLKGDASVDGASPGQSSDAAGGPVDALAIATDATTLRFGWIIVSQSRTPINTAVSALFYEGSDSSLKPAPMLAVGTCTTTRTRARQPNENSVPPSPMLTPPGKFMHAGRIELSGGGTARLVLEPRAMGGYAPLQVLSLTWAPSERVGIRAAGGMVPAFSLDLDFPAEVTLAEPARAAELPRDRDLTVRWNVTGSAGLVSIIASSQAPEFDTDVHCTAPAADGEFVVRRALLAELAPSDGQTRGVIGVLPSSTAETTPAA